MAAVALSLLFAAACSSTDGGSTEPAQPTPTATATPLDVAPEPAADEPPAAPAPDDAETDDRPNVVVFLTDDQTLESMRVMSMTAELIGAAGMTFSQSFVNVPVCCPSRATLLTGQRAANHGVLWNSGAKGGFQNFEGQDRTLVTALEATGYRTSFVGKYLNGYGFFPEDQFVPPGWTDFAGLVAPTSGLYTDNSFLVDGEIVDTGDGPYVTDVITDYALDDIDEAVAEGRPLFMLVGYTAPHGLAGLPLDELDYRTFPEDIVERYPDPFLVAPIPAARHAGSFADEPLPDNPALNEADVSDKPKFLQRLEQRPERIAELTDFYRAELESLLAVDESIAEIIGHLDALGELDDTYLLFTSDNGFQHGEHRILAGKYYPYEESTRVPLLIRGPGIAPGSTQDMVVSNTDLAPTILDIADAEPHREQDGISLLPVLGGAEPVADRAIVIEGFAFRSSAPPYIAVHTGTVLYVEWANGDRELYDLAADPYQLENLAGRPEHTPLESEMAERLDRVRDCSGSTCHPEDQTSRP